jgi:Lipid A core - O-antigen ligase and related enzymes
MDVPAEATNGSRSARLSLDDENPVYGRALWTVSLVLFSASVFLTLVSHGAVYPAAAALATGLMCLALTCLYFGLGVPVQVRLVFHSALVMWLIIVAIGLLQILPIPFQITGHPAWQVLFDLGIGDESFASVAPANVQSALVPIALPFAGLLTALLLFRNEKQIDLAYRAFCLTGGVVAAISVVQFVAFPDTLFFGPKVYYTNSLTGPFVNRNTAATFYGVTLLAHMAKLSGLSLPSLFQSPARSRSRSLTRSDILLLCSSIMTFVALLLTASRAGITASAIGILVFTVGIVLYPPPKSHAEAFRSDKQNSRSRRVTIALALAASVAALVWFFSGRAALRVETGGLEDLRFCVWPGILKGADDNWLTGVGLGGFEPYFPSYRDPACGTGLWEYAHNFYLDAYFAIGIIFVPLVLVALTFLLTVLARGIANRRRSRPLVWAGIASVVIVAVHSMIDFSIQIPGFGLWWAVLIALSARTSLGRQSRTSG